MRFILLLGLTLIAGRLGPIPSDVSGTITVVATIALVFDLVDFVMNIIKTFRK